jgi:hypothetical protein
MAAHPLYNDWINFIQTGLQKTMVEYRARLDTKYEWVDEVMVEVASFVLDLRLRIFSVVDNDLLLYRDINSESKNCVVLLYLIDKHYDLLVSSLPDELDYFLTTDRSVVIDTESEEKQHDLTYLIDNKYRCPICKIGEWKSVVSLTNHLNEHVSGSIDGDIPSALLVALKRTKCVHCGKLGATSSMKNGLHSKCTMLVKSEPELTPNEYGWPPTMATMYSTRTMMHDYLPDDTL